MSSIPDDLFYEPEMEPVSTEPVYEIHSIPSHTIMSIPRKERDILATYISERIYDEVTDPMRFNKSDASINANTLCDIRVNIEMSRDDARIIMQAYLTTHFPAHPMTILPRLNFKQASVQQAIKNKRAYTDVRTLIFAELKTNLKTVYAKIKADKKEASRQARIEAEVAEEKRIQQLRIENQQKKEEERKVAEEAELKARLQSIVLDIAEDEWD